MTDKKQDDRRVKYTKTVLRDTLISLLKDKPAGKITVKELCEYADINRSTFYAHYADVYDLLHRIEEEMLEDLANYLRSLYGIEQEVSRKTLTRLIEYIIENIEVCKVLLGEHGETEFIRNILMHVQRLSLSEWEDKIDPVTLEYTMVFSVYGTLGLIRLWIKNDLDKSAAEMSDLILSLIFDGFSRYTR